MFNFLKVKYSENKKVSGFINYTENGELVSRTFKLEVSNNIDIWFNDEILISTVIKFFSLQYKEAINIIDIHCFIDQTGRTFSSIPCNKEYKFIRECM
jgi:hypothetical protein